MKWIESHWWVIVAIVILWIFASYEVAKVKTSIKTTIEDLDPIPDTTKTTPFSFWQWVDNIFGTATVAG